MLGGGGGGGRRNITRGEANRAFPFSHRCLSQIKVLELGIVIIRLVTDRSCDCLSLVAVFLLVCGSTAGTSSYYLTVIDQKVK